MKLLARKVSQNFASFDFQASKALFSSDIRASLVGAVAVVFAAFVFELAAVVFAGAVTAVFAAGWHAVNAIGMTHSSSIGFNLFIFDSPQSTNFETEKPASFT